MSTSTFFEKKKFFDAHPTIQEIVSGTGMGADYVATHSIENALNTTPYTYVATGSLVSIDDCETTYLLDAAFKVLARVKSEYRADHNEAHTDNEFRAGETVGEAIARVGPENVSAAFSIHSGYKIENHCSVGGLSVTWYNIPEGFSLVEWVAQKMAEA